MMVESATKIARSLDQKIAREFQKPLFQDLDKRFTGILFGSLIVETVFVILLAVRPIPEYTDKDIARIQERFANFILHETPVKEGDLSIGTSTTAVSPAEELIPEDEAASEGHGEGEGSAGEGSGSGREMSPEARIEARMASAEARRRAREAISEEVSNKGLLGLLTGTGSAAEGEAVSSLFSGSDDEGLGGDLDKVLSSVGGLKSQGSATGSGSGSGGSVRGSRSGDKATIDDLVSGLGSAHSESLSRKGELKVESPADVIGRGRRSIYRSPEAIQEVLIRHNKAIQYCYERELKRNPTLKGKIVVRITVNPEGHVTEASIISSTLNNERVERCILSRISLWKDFPPINPEDGNITFRQGYIFGY
jgi:TonB family protein